MRLGPDLSRLVTLSWLALTTVACTARSDNRSAQHGDAASSAMSGASTPIRDTAVAGVPGRDTGVTGMPAMAATTGAPSTGNADHDFLRMMSDHHQGLILLAHESMERKDAAAVTRDARTLDQKQDEELDRMRAMLKDFFQDSTAPRVSPGTQAMVDSLLKTSGAAFPRTFWKDVITHHQQAIAMIDQFLPRLSRVPLKSMAEKMKVDQTQEISEFRKKLQAR